MHLEDYANYATNYLKKPLIETIYPGDQMFSGDMISYLAIGRSTVNAIMSIMPVAPKKTFAKVLDFGCGCGRVGRHLRALFPDAQLYFTDTKPDAVHFCARTFSGTGFASNADFNLLELPTTFDLIWVGSVFTHMDRERQEILFRRLCGALAPGGVLIATFHGRRCLELRKSGVINYIDDERWERIVASYRQTGFGYESYGRADLGDWGVSLNSIGSMTQLAQFDDRLRLLGISEAGWANHQDVLAYGLPV
jgi:SAM-dependent methyltransferase